jgi:hypothetical protein
MRRAWRGRVEGGRERYLRGVGRWRGRWRGLAGLLAGCVRCGRPVCTRHALARHGSEHPLPRIGPRRSTRGWRSSSRRGRLAGAAAFAATFVFLAHRQAFRSTAKSIAQCLFRPLPAPALALSPFCAGVRQQTLTTRVAIPVAAHSRPGPAALFLLGRRRNSPGPARRSMSDTWGRLADPQRRPLQGVYLLTRLPRRRPTTRVRLIGRTLARLGWELSAQ